VTYLTWKPAIDNLRTNWLSTTIKRVHALTVYTQYGLGILNENMEVYLDKYWNDRILRYASVIVIFTLVGTGWCPITAAL